MKRILLYAIGSLLTLIPLAPTIKNLILWSTYHHGRQSLEKTGGPPDGWGFPISVDPPKLWQLVDIWGCHPFS